MTFNLIKSIGGEVIDWEIAKELISKYNTHIGRWRGQNDVTLSAFRIELGKIGLLKEVELEGPEAKYLLIVPGYNDGTVQAPGTTTTPRKGFTTILMGVDENDNIIRDGSFSMLDFLDTIPPNNLNKIDGKHLHEL